MDGVVLGGARRRPGLIQALAGIEVRPLRELLGRAAGELLGTTRQTDVVDAALVLLACDGDEIIAADLAAIERLVAATGSTWSSCIRSASAGSAVRTAGSVVE